MTNSPLNGASLRGAVDLSSLVNKPSTAPNAGAASAQSIVSETNDADFTRILELSNTVPVIVEFYGQGIEPELADVVTSHGGRIALATVDANSNPQLAQAFQVQQVPTVAAVVAGRPLSLFVGLPTDDEVRDVLKQVLELAAQNGVTGQLSAQGEADAAEPVDAPLPPLHQEAFDAIERGDLPAAIHAYQTAIAQDPRDQLAVAGLAQASLMLRLHGKSASAIRVTAAQNPNDLHAQFDVADLDISGGHVDDAFDRILSVFPKLAQPDKNRARARLVEYFEIVGAEDPRVITARRRLTALLY
ncbi:MAG: tetratricopeptide repeat protein [Microbacteriaceae bacterium]